jgi:DNA replication protein DnaC
MCECSDGILLLSTEDGVILDFCDCERGRYKKYKLDALYQDWTFDTHPSIEAARLVYDWSIGPKDRWLLIEGPPGTGKTGLAVCVYKSIVDRMVAVNTGHGFLTAQDDEGKLFRPAQFWRWADLVEAHKRTFNNPDVIDPLDRAAVSIFLVLDDLGATDSQFDFTKASELIDRRYTMKRRTVITMNMDKDAFIKNLGQRTWDRVAQVSDRIALVGKSQRVAGIVKQVKVGI